MPNIVLSTSNPANGVNTLNIAQSIFDVLVTATGTNSSTQLDYKANFNELIAHGTFGGFNSNGDPTTGTVTSFEYFMRGGGGDDQKIAASGVSIPIANIFAWVVSSNTHAMELAMFGGNDNITGSAGNDTIAAYGADNINGGDGIDWIIMDWSTSSAAYTLDFAAMMSDAGGVVSAGMLFRNVERLQGVTGSGNDNVILTAPLANTSSIALGGGFDTLTVDFSASGATLQMFASNVVDISVGNLVVGGFEAVHATGGAGFDVLLGGAGNDTLLGGGGDDQITAAAGDDILDGGTGADTMVGGLGNDTYYVDNTSDIITESGGEGIDAALISVSGYTLSANVEVAALQGSAGFALTGNSLSNILYGAGGADTLSGGDGDDTLQGGAGIDTMNGGLGNDTFYVAQVGDTVNENSGEGFDATIVQMTSAYTLAANVEVGATFLGSGVNITGNGLDNLLYGGGGADTLSGAGGNDTIQGNAGADTMAGGLGNDTYFFEDAGDVITENSGEGIDAVIVFTSSYTLAANVEVGARFLTTAYTLTGNELDNQLYGNNGNDTLNGGDGNDTIQGGGGNDTMAGGLGNDTYFVEQAGDVVTENSNEGSDAVIVLIGSYTLAANVEVGATFLTSGASITGNGLDNRLYGNIGADTLNGGAGADLLDGGAGADTLTGGSENDVFSFVAGQANGDTVTDFDGGGANAGDQLWFAGYGTLAGGASFVQIDATHWQINSADGTIHDTITLSNGASVDASDWLFV